MTLPAGSYNLALYGTVSLPAAGESSHIVHVDAAGSFLLHRQKPADINGDFPGSFDLWRGETVAGASSYVADPVGLDPGYTEAHFGFFAGDTGKGHIDEPGYIWGRAGDKAVVFKYDKLTRSLVDPPSDTGLFSGTQFSFSVIGTAKRGNRYFAGVFEDLNNDNYAMLWTNLPSESGTASLFEPSVIKKNAFGGGSDVALSGNFAYWVRTNGILYRLNRNNLSIVSQLDISEAGWADNHQLVVVDDTLIFIVNHNAAGTRFRIRALNDFATFVLIGDLAQPANFGVSSFQYRELDGRGFFYTHASDEIETYIWVFDPIFNVAPPEKAWCLD